MNVTGRQNAGSLIGRGEGRVYATYATGSVTGTGTVGGLIAHTRSTAVVAGSWADVDVTADSNLGGLVGLHVGGDIIACYATGSVTVAGSGQGLYRWPRRLPPQRRIRDWTYYCQLLYRRSRKSRQRDTRRPRRNHQGSPVTTDSYWDTTPRARLPALTERDMPPPPCKPLAATPASTLHGT